jgi:3-hydroxyacyl-[acyl-carrier-protein] dehydratase
MPPTTLYDLSKIDLNKVAYDVEFIRSVNPQRGDMEHLDGIAYCDQDGVIGFKDVKVTEFWVPGHIPGRPLLPGVIMLEAAAQVASFYTKVVQKWEGFVGFGGVDEVKFRTSVSPGCRIYILNKMTWKRHRRICCDSQGLVNGNIVFEAKITGVQM